MELPNIDNVPTLQLRLDHTPTVTVTVVPRSITYLPMTSVGRFTEFHRMPAL